MIDDILQRCLPQQMFTCNLTCFEWVLCVFTLHPDTSHLPTWILHLCTMHLASCKVPCTHSGTKPAMLSLIVASHPRWTAELRRPIWFLTLLGRLVSCQQTPEAPGAIPENTGPTRYSHSGVSAHASLLLLLCERGSGVPVCAISKDICAVCAQF